MKIKRKKKTFYEIILDDVSHKDEAYRFKDFLKFFKDYVIISRVDLDKEKITSYLINIKI